MEIKKLNEYNNGFDLFKTFVEGQKIIGMTRYNLPHSLIANGVLLEMAISMFLMVVGVLVMIVIQHIL
jgi:sulfatase maturation enzyme AslB (radical SAM superfamily)